MKFKKTTEVKRTHEFESTLRRNEMPAHQKDAQTAIEAKNRYYSNGKLSLEVFTKTAEEKQRLKELKKNCNNSKFQKILRLKTLGLPTTSS